MKTGEPKNPEQDQTAVKVYYSNATFDIMHIELPLKHFAQNEIGTVLCKGFLDDIKEMALKIMREMRKKEVEKASKIIVPGSTAVPIDLKVH